LISSLKALGVTLSSFKRKKVTAEYPKEHLPVDKRYMGFPALLWDSGRDEPFCTGCMVCVRYCPTQCMTAEMHDNPKFASGDSHRRKIIEKFEINLNRCILCGICVEVCNFDAIEMSHEHELAGRGRNDQRVDLPQLLAMGSKYQTETGWKPSKPNAPSPKEKDKEAAAG
jgi:NADH-quinone oxidoreductase subunit I/NADH dehydrogenase (ubiquinone) Fe-S protein 8